MAVSNGT